MLPLKFFSNKNTGEAILVLTRLTRRRKLYVRLTTDVLWYDFTGSKPQAVGLFSPTGLHFQLGRHAHIQAHLAKALLLTNEAKTNIMIVGETSEKTVKNLNQ